MKPASNTTWRVAWDSSKWMHIETANGIGVLCVLLYRNNIVVPGCANKITALDYVMDKLHENVRLQDYSNSRGSAWVVARITSTSGKGFRR